MQATSVESDEDYQQQLIRSLFNSGHEDEELDDHHNDISEHEWKIDIRPAFVLFYHLAFRAPGHGDSLWNSSECIARHLLIPELRSLVLGDERDHWPPAHSIEFGAGAALPSLVLLKEGAGRVTMTDRYVNQQTFEALRMSVDKNAEIWGAEKERAVIIPHTWGEDVERLTIDAHGDKSGASRKGDLLIASDCIYNPTYHTALLQSAVGAMAKLGKFIVGYSFHGNVPPSQVLDFFARAKDEFGLEVVSEFSEKYDGQRGIGDMDKNRGVVYVKVLLSKG